MAWATWVGRGIEDDASAVRFSLSAEGPEALLAVTGAFAAFLALLWTSGSPLSSTRSVGRRLRGPTTMLGSDMSVMASYLSSGMAEKNRLDKEEGEELPQRVRRWRVVRRYPQGYIPHKYIGESRLITHCRS